MIENILYVEDENDSREFFSQLLQDYCTNLFIAKDGQEGLELYKKNPIDVVLTDITMPKMNGLEMSKKILEIDEDAYIVVLSAYGESDFLHKAIDIGIHNYLLKPIDIEKLEDVLNKINKQLRTSKLQELHTQELKEINQTLHQKVKEEIAKNAKILQEQKD